MPILFAVIIPITTITPFLFDDTTRAALSDEVPEPWNPKITGELNKTSLEVLVDSLDKNETLFLKGYWIHDVKIDNGTIENSRLENVNLRQVVLIRCRIINATITVGWINDSYIEDSRITKGILEDCVGDNVIVTDDVEIENCGITRLDNPGGFSVKMYFIIIIDTLMVFFMLVPAIIPTIVASFSMIGEKKAKSLEPLLATPISDSELLAGKILSVFIPTMAATIAAYFIFAIIMEFMVGSLVGPGIVLTINWFLVVFIAGSLMCFLSISSNVLISSRVNDIRAAQQLGSFVILPMILILFMSIGGVVILDTLFIVLFIILLAVLDSGLFMATVKMFNREKILVGWK
jgi:ABC-2 type transport system permease protein